MAKDNVSLDAQTQMLRQNALAGFLADAFSDMDELRRALPPSLDKVVNHVHWDGPSATVIANLLETVKQHCRHIPDDVFASLADSRPQRSKEIEDIRKATRSVGTGEITPGESADVNRLKTELERSLCRQRQAFWKWGAVLAVATIAVSAAISRQLSRGNPNYPHPGGLNVPLVNGEYRVEGKLFAESIETPSLDARKVSLREATVGELSASSISSKTLPRFQGLNILEPDNNHAAQYSGRAEVDGFLYVISRFPPGTFVVTCELNDGSSKSYYVPWGGPSIVLPLPSGMTWQVRAASQTGSEAQRDGLLVAWMPFGASPAF